MFRFVITCFISITIYIGSKGGGNAHGSNTFDVETNRQKCNGEEQIKCWSGQCVSITVKCNRIKDCEDGSDEQSSLCETMLCGDKQFQCHYGACIPIEAKCNGTQECWDGTDENEKLCGYEIDITSIQTTVGTITRDTTILPPTKIATKWPQTVGNQYNISTTTILPPNKVTTKRQQTVFNRYKTHATTTTKPIKECVLRNCDYPLFCKISIPGSRNSNAIHYQRRLSLIERSQVIFNCAEGYYLVGANRLTCTPRGWSHSSPSCKPYCDADFIHNCRPPLKCLFEQPNSRSKIFITKEFTQRVREHSQISFACDEGYLLEGPTMRKCTARGWSNEIPRCVNHCDISDLGNLSSPLKCNVFDSNIQSLEGYQYSTWNKMIKESSYFEFTCEDGYKLDGENRSTCMNNGWSSAAPTCIPLCDLSLVSPCTAPLLCRHNHKTSFFNFGNRADVVLPGVHVDYSCEDGYELDGAMFITCTNNGWSNRIPTCKETVCDVSIFADCTYPLKCKIYDRTLRKYKSIYRRDIPELSNNENLYVNCEDGYTLQGSQYLACRGRKWDGIMPKCFEKISKTCEQEILDNCIYPMICERFESEFSDFIKVKFSCENGYMLDGGNSLTCTDGKWDHNLPKCIAHSCSGHLIPICEHPLICTLFDAKSKSKQKIINNNIIQSTNYTLDTQIIFSCGYGYKLKGAEQTTCGSNGWSHEQSLKLPQCINHCDISDLGNLSSPLKCNVFDSNIQSLEGYQYSTWNKMIKESSYFEFTCEDGYKLDGENRSTCMNNGWSSAAPTCIPLCDLSLVSPCTAPLLCRHNHKTSFFNFGNRADVVLPGVHVDYSCEDGYELDGAMFITCTNNGWSNRIPTCKETVCDVSIFADCTYPLKCKIYDRTLRKYKSIYRRDIPELSNNENLYVNCEDGYTLQGSQYLACRGRKWDGIMPKCFEKISKTCEQEILDNCIYPMICERFESEFRDFIKVKFSCENGYMLDGGNSLTCTDGKWDHNLPKCIVAHSCSGHLIPICEHPLICTLFDAKSKSKQKIINNNIIQSTNYTLDTQIIFSCGYGYKLKGAEQTTCGSNGWSHEQSLKLPQCTKLMSSTSALIALPIEKKCQIPANLSDIIITKTNFRTNIDVGSSVSTNTLVTFACQPGYQLDGDETLLCTDDGWNKKVPVCYSRNYCDARVLNEDKSITASCLFESAPVACEKIKPNTIAVIKCAIGYQQKNVPQKTILSCTNEYKWSRPITPCEIKCGELQQYSTPFARNGIEIQISEVPWHVGIYSNLNKRDFKHICGGSIVSNRLVVSAAHCFYDEANSSPYENNFFKVSPAKVKYSYNVSDGVDVTNIYIPEIYKGSNDNYYGDIAIITLQQPFIFNHSVKPICFQYIFGEAAAVETGRDSFIIGWGPTESSHYKDVLQKVEVTTLSYNSCNETLNGKATQRYDLAVDKFCVVRKGTSGELCRGDSGGGFVKSTNGQYYLVGVISHAPLGNVDCARENLIALTNVQYYVKIRQSIEDDQIEN